jgi:hypothetical protein
LTKQKSNSLIVEKSDISILQNKIEPIFTITEYEYWCQWAWRLYALAGDSYPDWLTFNCKGSSIIFVVPRVQGRNL